MSAKSQPVMQQFLAAKAAYPDAVVFFRLGDFYEMFFDDAVEMAPVLDLTLTSRNKNAPDSVPMVGFPVAALPAYTAKLLALGRKVALCEQMADPSKTRGIVPREVVRVLTPGLVTSEAQLDAREPSYVAALDRGDGGALGLAFFDLSTGELRAAEVAGLREAVAELARSAPREVLLPDGVDRGPLAHVGAALRDDPPLDDPGPPLTTALGADEAARARASMPITAVRAAARALRFAAACNPRQALPTRAMTTWDATATLALDETAQRHLELLVSVDGTRKHTLLELLDRTKTPLGARTLRRRLVAPFASVAEIRRRHDEVDLFVTHATARDEVRAALDGVGDLERLTVRAALGEATPRDLGHLRDALAAAPAAAAALTEIPGAQGEAVFGLDAEPFDPVAHLAEHLAAALVDRPPPTPRDGPVLREGYDPTLDEARALSTDGARAVAALEARLREETGIGNLKVAFTRVFGWYIELTGKHASKAPREWRRKQTVANAERFTTDELDDLSDRILHADETATQREQELLRALVADVAADAPRLSRLAARLASWDVAAALADVAHRRGYTRPLVDDSRVIELEGSRHPVVESLMPEGSFVPNDVTLDGDGARLLLITGPNRAGKSTVMRQVALAVIMAQAGGFVAARRARIGVVDRVLSRVGASDDLARGESTFMVEMRETANILRHATPKSLVVLDEIGRGTSTYDGLSIAWAVTEHLHDVSRCRALFATHYHELTTLPDALSHAANASVSARELDGDVVFLHQLVRGAASRSYGLAVAKLAGLPESLLSRAACLLAELEGDGAKSATSVGPKPKRRADTPQLGLFAPAQPTEAASPHPAVEALRKIDPLRLTPMDALVLVARLRELV